MNTIKLFKGTQKDAVACTYICRTMIIRVKEGGKIIASIPSSSENARKMVSEQIMRGNNCFLINFTYGLGISKKMYQLFGDKEEIELIEITRGIFVEK